MLGIRRYGPIQIDVFQGDIARFVCDAMVSSVGSTPTGPLSCHQLIDVKCPQWAGGDNHELESLTNVMNDILTIAHRSQIRHLCLPALPTEDQAFPKDLAAKTLMTAVKSFYAHEPAQFLRRITFVLNESALYSLFRDTLWDVFPD